MADESNEIRPEVEPQPGGGQVVVDSAVEQEPTELDVPKLLSVLPLKNTVLFPFLLSPLLVSSARSKRLIDRALLSPQRMLVTAAVRGPVTGSPGPDDVYRIERDLA